MTNSWIIPRFTWWSALSAVTLAMSETLRTTEINSAQLRLKWNQQRWGNEYLFHHSSSCSIPALRNLRHGPLWFQWPRWPSWSFVLPIPLAILSAGSFYPRRVGTRIQAKVWRLMIYVALFFLALIIAGSGALWLVLVDATWNLKTPQKILLSLLWLTAYVVMLTVLNNLHF